MNAIDALALGLIAAITIGLLVLMSPIGRDDSDPGQWGGRSGVNVHTDSLTGCQYLSRSGGLTPRLDRWGRQVGCRP